MCFSLLIISFWDKFRLFGGQGNANDMPKHFRKSLSQKQSHYYNAKYSLESQGEWDREKKLRDGGRTKHIIYLKSWHKYNYRFERGRCENEDENNKIEQKLMSTFGELGTKKKS